MSRLRNEREHFSFFNITVTFRIENLNNIILHFEKKISFPDTFKDFLSVNYFN